MNKNLAFYLMNEKGFYVLKQFIEQFSAKSISYIVCNKDKNLKKDYFIEIKSLCEMHKILFFNRNDDLIPNEKYFAGYKLAIGWRWLIQNDKNLIVFHDSLLPKYRGFAPMVNILINKDDNGGVTALFANSSYDTGDIIMQKTMDINYPLKISEAIKQLKPLYFELVRDIYNLILKDKQLPTQKQNEQEATYSLWLDDKDYFIDWKNWSAKKIKCFVDAVGFPYDNAKAYLNSKVVKFINVDIVEDVRIEHRERHIGKVIFIKDGYPVVICEKGLISLIDIQDKDNNKLLINFRSRFE